MDFQFTFKQFGRPNAIGFLNQQMSAMTVVDHALFKKVARTSTNLFEPVGNSLWSFSDIYQESLQ